MTEQTVSVIDSAVDCPELPIVAGPGSARAVIWPGSGARHRSFNLVELKPGSKTVDLSHAADSVYYVIAGTGSVRDVASGEVSDLVEGSMVHIDAGDTYRFECAAASDMKLLGGPCPADEALYADLAKG